MSKYTMNIRFKEEDLDSIAKAHQKVILVKHTAGSEDSPVVWVSFNPYQQNTIEWENSFAIYASNSEVQSGATINKLSDKMAAGGVQYDFTKGAFGNPRMVNGIMEPNTCHVRNGSDDYPAITLGLAQDVVVNGEAKANKPINAVYAPFGQLVSMTPLEKIDVYLLKDTSESTVITQVQSSALSVVYGEGETARSVAYDGKTGRFYIEA